MSSPDQEPKYIETKPQLPTQLTEEQRNQSTERQLQEIVQLFEDWKLNGKQGLIPYTQEQKEIMNSIIESYVPQQYKKDNTPSTTNETDGKNS